LSLLIRFVLVDDRWRFPHGARDGACGRAVRTRRGEADGDLPGDGQVGSSLILLPSLTVTLHAEGHSCLPPPVVTSPDGPPRRAGNLPRCSLCCRKVKLCLGGQHPGSFDRTQWAQRLPLPPRWSTPILERGGGGGFCHTSILHWKPSKVLVVAVRKRVGADRDNPPFPRTETCF